MIIIQDKSNWRDIELEVFPWIKSFNRIVKSGNPPALNGPTLLISSDYSGELAKQKYTVLSYLVVDLHKIMDWEPKRRYVRNELLKDNRRMSFKGLNDKIKANALPLFLDAANYIHGYLMSVVLHKNVFDILHSEELYNRIQQTNPLQKEWKKDTFRRMSNITFFLSLLEAGLSKPHQNIYWYSDEDNLFSNEQISLDVARLMSHFSSFFIPHPPGECGIGTTKLNEQDFLEEDLNAIPDLVSGSLAEFFEKASSLTDLNRLQNFAYLYPKNISSKTKLILDWLAYTEGNLKKVTVVFDRYNDTGGYKIWKFDTEQSPIQPLL